MHKLYKTIRYTLYFDIKEDLNCQFCILKNEVKIYVTKKIKIIEKFAVNII